MDFLHNKEKNTCDQCGEKFSKHEDLINHARHIHHHTIVKCKECGKEFVHEKDRLHHVREEHEKEMDARVHKNEHRHKKGDNQRIGTPQEEEDEFILILKP